MWRRRILLRRSLSSSLPDSFRRAYLPVLKQFDKPFDVQAFHGTTAAFVADRERHQLVFNSAALVQHRSSSCIAIDVVRTFR
jgi:hypothetical protein